MQMQKNTLVNYRNANANASASADARNGNREKVAARNYNPGDISSLTLTSDIF